MIDLDLDSWAPGDEVPRMTQVAASLRRDRLLYHHILSALRNLGAMLPGSLQCPPPSVLQVIATLAESMVPIRPHIPPHPEFAPTSAPEYSHWLGKADEMGVAEMVLTDLGGAAEAKRILGALRTFNGHFWEPYSREELQGRVIGYRDWPILSAKPGELGQPVAHALPMSARFKNGAADLVASTVPEVIHHKDAVPGVCFQDCFVAVDEATGALTPTEHRPEQYALEEFPYPHTPGERPTIFIDTFLRGCFADHTPQDQDDMIEVIRQFIGLALVGMTHRFRLALMLVGEGRNGKSTLQNVVKALFQDAAVSVQPADFVQGPIRDSLANSRINIVAELSASDWKRTDYIKAVVTGDGMNANPKYLKPYNFKARSAQIYGCNTLPKVADNSDGFWSRWRVLPFNQTFDGARADATLEDRIVSGEVGTIASWALESLADIFPQGRSVCDPRPSQAAKSLWRQESDPALAFLLSIVAGRKDTLVSAEILKQEFMSFIAENAYDNPGWRRVLTQLQNYGLEATRGAGGRRGYRVPDDLH